TVIHDIACGLGDLAAVETACANNHTDGLAIFGGANVTLDSVTFYRNDITNIRIQNCCGNAIISDLTIKNSVFRSPRVGPANGDTTNCTRGLRADAIDVDSSIPNIQFLFNTFADQTYMDCTGPTGCGSVASPGAITGNIFSLPDGQCKSNTTYSYNAVNAWG